MAKLNGAINRIIREQCRQQVDRGMTAIAKVGRDMVLEKRRELTDMWFRGFNSQSINDALRCTPIKQRTSMTTGTVNLMTFIDVDAYKEKTKAEKWKAKYGEDVDGELVDSKLYVLDLQLYRGIIGLPEKAKARPDSQWKNPAPHIYEPLADVLEQQLMNKEFKDKIIKAAGLNTEKKER